MFSRDTNANYSTLLPITFREWSEGGPIEGTGRGLGGGEGVRGLEGLLRGSRALMGFSGVPKYSFRGPLDRVIFSSPCIQI